MSYRDGSSYTLTNGQRLISSGSSSDLQDNDLSKTSPAKNSPAFLLGGSDAQCKQCGKHVYEMEKTMADQIVYHKSCFRCTQCKKLLNASTFTSYGGVLYCKPHFIELLKPKGQCKDMDDAESEQDLNGEENMKTPALPAVRDMKGLFETHGQTKGSFSFQASNSNYAKSSSNREKPSIEPSLMPINRIVNDDDDDDEDSEVLPPADITRNLVAKFRQLEKGDGSDFPMLPKPVRQFTPPRESPERSGPGVITREPLDVGDVGDVGDVVRCGDPAEMEDELPPPCITRNLIAKFGSRVETGSDEDDQGFRPGRSSGPVPDRRTSVRFLEEIEYADGGVFENDPEEILDVVRETDSLDETDLPETGMARALVEQWKSLESEAEKSRPQFPSTGSMYVAPITLSRSPATGGKIGMSGGKIGMSGVNPGSRTVGAGMEAESEETGYPGMDETPEDDLPPQDITRNLLAKFKTISVDQQPTSSQTSSKKQFRWDVKEAKPVNYPGLVTVSKTAHIGERPDQDEDGGDEEDEDKESYEDDSGDHPSYAKIMLQKFRSMEKS